MPKSPAPVDWAAVTGDLGTASSTFASVFSTGAGQLSQSGTSAADGFVAGISGTGAQVGENAANAFRAGV